MESTFIRSSSPLGGESLALDFANLPVVYILSTHFDVDELHEIEERITAHGVLLTYDLNEARVIFGKVGTKRRAEHDLRVRGLPTLSVEGSIPETKPERPQTPPRKKRRTDDGTNSPIEDLDTTASEGSVTADDDEGNPPSPNLPYGSQARNILEQSSTKSITSVLSYLSRFGSEIVPVFKIQWFEDCLSSTQYLPIEPYLVFTGKRVKPSSQPSVPTLKRTVTETQARQRHTQDRHTATAQTILERAKADAANAGKVERIPFSHGARRLFDPKRRDHSRKQEATKTKLLVESTSECEGGDDSDLPPEPEWVKSGVKYACERSTPPDPPNEAFIDQLKEIRTARILMLDEIGVRAYSTSIAAIASYPFPITSPKEILKLPGCDHKIANLWIEWTNTGAIKEAQSAVEDPTLKILRLFYNIWGVGAQTAREFHYDKGWQELDDIVDFGWSTLTRVQQIGVKYYEEFLTPIPRDEVESIAAIIKDHAARVRDEKVEVIVVGGYRRGKKESGDVDVIVSHPDLASTSNLAHDIVNSLEGEEWITHTLILSEHNSHRGQATLPYRAPGVGGGHGFDSLDKALVVWQDPTWPTKEEDLVANPEAKNPNFHRRVDIIISPWRTVGCAVVGWSGGTTFQRDLRRYARHVKGWKFDSSGVRDRTSGRIVPLEGQNGAETWQEAERKVFEGMGLVYREPWERCTG